MAGDQTTTKAVHVRIKGRVQGVWFRGWTVDAARERGLAGWVRNRSDGSVEAVFAGPATRVDDMLQACWSGPAAAKVSAVEARPADEAPATGFEQRATV